MLALVFKHKRLQSVLPTTKRLFRPARRRVVIEYALLAVLLLFVGITINNKYTDRQNLLAAQANLVTKASVDLSKVKASGNGVTYNRGDELKSSRAQSISIAAAADSGGNKPYQATLAHKAKDGITFTNSQGDMQIKLVPQFSLGDATYQNGHVTYAESGTSSHEYTLKRNGIKEDIILTTAPADTVSYSWNIKHGSALEARMLPDGGVGFYGSSLSRMPNIQASSAADQALLAKARANGAKDTLVFAIPNPYIKAASGKTDYTDVHYSLKGDVLSLTATHLQTQKYPLSIDPSIVITTTSDFLGGNDDGMINYATANEIDRATVGGGAVGATAQQTNAFTNARSGQSSVVYNGYLYIIGGFNGATRYNDIQYCSLTAGVVGTCTVQPNAFTSARDSHSSVVYNGYLYIIGGFAAASATGCDVNGKCNDIQYCPINGGGSVGTCTQQTTAFTTPRYGHTSVVYNGFLYIIGGFAAASATGCDVNGKCGDIQYCPINASGSVGACTQQLSAFTTPRTYHTSVVYNGYLYIIGGLSAATTANNDIQYCPVNANGSVGACTQQTSAFTGGLFYITSVVSNGYLYIIGGDSSAAGAANNNIDYCPLNANGSVGACTQQAAAFTSARWRHSSVVYNGYLYVIGGEDASSAYYNDIQHLLLATTSFSGGSAKANTQQLSLLNVPRSQAGIVIYNGYIYIVGGLTDTGTETGCTSAFNCNDIMRCPINADGSVSACSQQTAAFTSARNALSAVEYNGYLYIIAGSSATASVPGCDANAFCSDIQYCPISANHTVGSCTQQLAKLPNGRSNVGVVAYNGYIYITGGSTGTASVAGCDANFTPNCNDINRCPINTDHSIGTCGQQLAIFPNPRNAHTTVVYNGTLYIIGGQTSTASVTGCDASAYCNDIIHCNIIAATHLIGTCTQQTAAFNNPRLTHSSAVYNGYIYISGGAGSVASSQGCDVNSNCNDTNYCKINSDGTIATPCTQQTNAFTTARQNLMSAVSNGNLYIIGGQNTAASTTGCNANFYCSDVQRLPLNAPSSSARYEKTIDTGASTTSFNSILINGTSPCDIEMNYSTAPSSGVYSAASYMPLVMGATTTLSVSAQRYLRINLQFKDDRCGTTSNITDVTLNYTASNSPPASPTLSTPSSGATSVSTSPSFTLKTTDPDSDYLRYTIVLFQSDCTTPVAGAPSSLDETVSQTGWSGQDKPTGGPFTGYAGSTTIGSSTLATYTYQGTLTGGVTYCWQARAIDPVGSNVASAYSSTQLFTTAVVQVAPSAPILTVPTGASALLIPTFKMSSSDGNSDYIKYKINICSDNLCNTVLQTVDQTISQTGWSGQDANGGTAYVGSPTQSSSTLGSYTLTSALSPNTTYYWRAYGIDPGGSNTFGSASTISSFTTVSLQTNLTGGINLTGGTKLGN